jgi:lysophospholipase L1-like esterase
MASIRTAKSPAFKSFSSLLIALGGAVLLSAFLIEPLIAGFRNVTNYRDVLSIYFRWAMSIGFLMVVNGILLRWTMSDAVRNMSLLFMTCALILLSDRLLLAGFGLPLWIADLDNHYKHRPNAVRSWSSHYNNKLIQINSYGYHDDEFPLKKNLGQFRAVMLGDSITMGHGVSREETFANQLETRLNAISPRSAQIINAGVQGYATFQEYNAFLDSLVFEPDFVAIGFCMNDLVEPFVVNRRFGGVGVDYHGIMQTSSVLTSYLLNETGYGRLVQKLRSRGKSVERAKRWEMFSVEAISRTPFGDPKFMDNWRIVLDDLDKLYAAAKERKIRVALLIFPFTFQLANTKFKEPQRVLSQHAKSREVDVIDFTEVFEKIIFDDDIAPSLMENAFSPNDVRTLYGDKLHRYFLDGDHYTVEGHKIVASILYDYVTRHYSF